jgi:hypothetical protein
MANPQTHTNPSTSTTRPKRQPARSIPPTSTTTARPSARRVARSAGVGQPNLASSPPADAPRLLSKQATIATMLQHKNGATIIELMTATGWQAHSVRAVLSGLRKTGLQIDRSRGDDGVSRYRAIAGA